MVAFEKRRRELHRSLEAFRSHAENAVERGQEQGRFFVGSRLGAGSGSKAQAKAEAEQDDGEGLGVEAAGSAAAEAAAEAGP